MAIITGISQGIIKAARASLYQSVIGQLLQCLLEK